MRRLLGLDAEAKPRVTRPCRSAGLHALLLLQPEWLSKLAIKSLKLDRIKLNHIRFIEFTGDLTLYPLPWVFKTEQIQQDAKSSKNNRISQNVLGLYAYLDHLRPLGTLQQFVKDQSLWLLQLLSAWKSICCLTLFYGTAGFTIDDRKKNRRKRGDTCRKPQARHVWCLLLTEMLVTQMMKCQMNQRRKCSLANPCVWPKGDGHKQSSSLWSLFTVSKSHSIIWQSCVKFASASKSSSTDRKHVPQQNVRDIGAKQEK